MVNKNTKIAKKPSDKQKKKAVANYVLFLEYLSLALTVGLIFYLIYISNSIQDCVQAINSTADPFNPQDPLFIILGIVASFGVKALIKAILGGFYRRNLIEKASNRDLSSSMGASNHSDKSGNSSFHSFGNFVNVLFLASACKKSPIKSIW